LKRTDISLDHAIGYKHFITNSLNKFKAAYANENQIQGTGEYNTFKTGAIVKVNNYDSRVVKLGENLLKLTIGQRNAYDKAIRHLTGVDSDQLIMFVSGEGGTGKSTLIELIMEFTRLHFGKQRGTYGPAVAMGPTGTSSYNINGYTWQSVKIYMS
jgi:type IV secretory pathway VirB4 component